MVFFPLIAFLIHIFKYTIILIKKLKVNDESLGVLGIRGL